MQQRSRFQRLGLHLVETQLTRDPHGIHLHPPQVVGSGAVLGIDGQSQRLDRAQVQTGRDGTSYPARALSDGTLRFLALTVLSIEPDSRGVICMEEPENGIHPERIPAMIQLLRDLTTDVRERWPDGSELRQVIVNTHSPSVVMQEI